MSVLASLDLRTDGSRVTSSNHLFRNRVGERTCKSLRYWENKLRSSLDINRSWRTRTCLYGLWKSRSLKRQHREGDRRCPAVGSLSWCRFCSDQEQKRLLTQRGSHRASLSARGLKTMTGAISFDKRICDIPREIQRAMVARPPFRGSSWSNVHYLERLPGSIFSTPVIAVTPLRHMTPTTRFLT